MHICILKSRDITLPTKVYIVKAMVFPVNMYGCESWIVKKLSTEELMLSNCGTGKTLKRVPWTARRSNQSMLKEINPEHSLEGLILKLKLKPQYFSHLMRRADSLEKTLILGKIEGQRRRGQQRMRRLDGITDSLEMSLSKGQVNLTYCMKFTGSQRVRHDLATEQQKQTLRQCLLFISS